MKNLAMLPDYFDYIFVHLRQKVRLRPESSPKFLSTLSLNPARTRPEKPGPTYNSGRSEIMPRWESSLTHLGIMPQSACLMGVRERRSKASPD